MSLDVLGISSDEEKIYRILLVSGQLSIGEINFVTKIAIDSIKDVLSSLVTKNLARKIPGIQSRYASLLPSGPLKDELISSVKNIERVSGMLDEKSKNVVMSLNEKLQKSSSELSTQITNHKADVESDVDSLNEAFQTKKGEVATLTDTTVNNLTNGNYEILSKFTLSSTNTVEEKVNAMKDSINSKLASIENRTEEIKNGADEIKKTANQGLPAQDISVLENVNKEIVGKLDGVKSKYLTQASSLNQSYNTHLGNLQSEFSNSKSEFEGLKATLEAGFESISSQMKERLDQSHSQSRVEMNNANQNADKFMAENSNRLDSNKSQLTGNSENIKLGSQGIISNFDKLEQEFSLQYSRETTDLQNSITNTLDMISSNFTTKFSSSKDQIQNQLEIMVGQFLEQSKKLLSDLAVEIENSVSTSKSNLQGEVISSVNRLGEIISAQGTQRKTSFLNFVNESSTTQTSITENLQSQIDVLIQGFQQISEEFKATIQGFENGLSSYKSASDEILNDFNTSHHSLVDTKFLGVLNELQVSFDGAIADLRQASNTAMQNLQDELETTHSEMNQSLSEALSELKVKTQELHSTSLARLDIALNDMHNKYLEYIEQIKTSSVASVTQLGTDTGKLQEVLTEIYETANSNLTSEFSSFAELIKNNANELFGGISSKVEGIIGSVKATTTSSFDLLEGLSRSNVSDQINAVRSSLSEYNQSYKNSTGEIVTKTTAMANLFENIFKIQEETETIEIKTSHIVGEQAIHEQIKDIISRVKSKVVILVPAISYIDDDSILALPSSAQVTLVSYIDESSDKKWIDKMHDATANVTLRAIQTSGGTLPDFIGCEREGEEILFAAKDESANDYVGLTSLSEDFVKILGNILLSEWVRGRSKQLPK